MKTLTLDRALQTRSTAYVPRALPPLFLGFALTLALAGCEEEPAPGLRELTPSEDQRAPSLEAMEQSAPRPPIDWGARGDLQSADQSAPGRDGAALDSELAEDRGSGGDGEVAGDQGERCEDAEELFLDSLWGPLFQRRCFACHNEEGLAGGTRMVFVDEDTEGWVEHNLSALTAVSEAMEDGVPLLLLKPSGQLPHTGGNLVELNSERYALLEGLAGRLNGTLDPCGAGADADLGPPTPPGDCAAPAPGRRLLRRLSHREYSNTVRDVLGVSIDAEGSFAADPHEHHFDNHPERLVVSGLLATQYAQLAETLGEQVDAAALSPCPLAEGNMECAHTLIATLGRRMYRRPLTAEEIAGYRALFALVMEQECFEQGIRWVVTAMLQSPHFLYRSELGRRSGDHFELTPYELAAELSYLLWQSAPDDELLDLAAEGALLRPAVRAAQLQRLLEDPRSDEMVAEFFGSWLGFKELMMVVRDPEIYAALYFELRASMLAETRNFIEELWHNEAPFEQLFGADHSYLDAPLAEYYGIELGGAPGDAGAPQRTALRGRRGGGVLAHGSLLTTHAAPTSSSPIHRGVFVREQLLCAPLPPPPEGLDIMPPDFDPNRSTRERFAAHTADPRCEGCHRLIDGVGFGFESYDGIGRYREEESGVPIDASGLLIAGGGAELPFDGLQELGALLGRHEEAQRCYVRQWLRFGLGEQEGLDLECTLEALGARFEADDARLPGVLYALTELPHFTIRSGEPEELDVSGSELTPARPGEPPALPDPAIPPPMLETPACGVPPTPLNGPVIGAPGLAVNHREDRWETGYCAYYTLANESAEPIEWALELDIEGTINNLWNAERDGDSGRVRVWGVAWNAVIAPAQQIEFGFCATL